MKTLTRFTLSLACAAGLLGRAAAQDAPPVTGGDTTVTNEPAAAEEAAAAQDQAVTPAMEPPVQPVLSQAEILQQLQALQEQNEALRGLLLQQAAGQGQMQPPRGQAGPPEGRSPRSAGRDGMRPPETGAAPLGTNLVASNDTNATIRMNFRNAQLEPVLNYLSEAAGYTIVLETQIRGTVDIWSEHLMTRPEAIQALNAAVSKNGFAVVKEGNLLRILSSGSRNDVGIPTITVSSTNDVSRTAEIVTAIIPIRYISASEVINNVYPLLPSSAQMTANIGGNSLVLTDTKATVRRIVEVIRALDNPIASGTSFQVIPLNYADAKTVQAVIQGLYQNQGRGGAQGANPFLQMMQNMGGRGGMGGGGFGGGGRRGGG